MTLAVVCVRATGARVDPPVTLDVMPTVCFDPCDVRLRVRILADSENRKLTVTAESDTYLRRSVRDLDGDAAPRTFVMVATNLPAGAYVVEARLERVSGNVITASHAMTVRAEAR